MTEVHLREFTMTGPRDPAWSAFASCCEDLDDRAVLLIRPDPRLQSMMTAGEDAARDVSFPLNVLAIELAPAAATTASEDAPVYTAADTEALEGTAMLQAACYAPQLARSEMASRAEVTLDEEPRTGEAIVAVDGDVDRVLKLAGSDGEDGFCLILMGRGGPSEPGTYPIVKLAMDRMESEANPADPWMVASLASGADRETRFVAESGFVEIISMEPSVRGRFELIGWTGDGVSRSEEETITGSFEAAPAAR